ncbi:plasmid mobilization relaxosome protein MobC [Nubsella zeaxanthinifaciens]|jgi:cation transport regulator ChaC|uniref:plasmid mobilization relaxosome protein MobC n=1 Tax=Nubsella zeaxanthinifaciens TaxID=392412 RepID=UPI003CFECE4A
MANDASFDRRVRRFELRLSEAEHGQFLELERTLGISRADIVRIRVLKNSTKMLLDTRELFRRLDRIGAELGRSGNNINQLAKHANVLNKRGLLTPDILELFNKLFTDHINVQKEMEKQFRQLIRLMKGQP